MGRGLKITVAVLLTLLVLIVLNAFALNNETEPAAINVPGATLVETTSGQLQVLDTGEVANPDAMPIVLIHGSGGAINWWDDLIPLLSPGHRVVAVDLLGYGGSAKPDSGYEVETQAALIAQVLAKLQIGKATVVGHSFGGKVATAMAEQSPDLVAGITLIDMAPDSSYGGLSGSAKAVQWPLLGQALWRIAPDSIIRRNVAQGFAPGYDVPDKYVDDVRNMTYPAYSGSYDASNDYTDAKPLNERLAATGIPLLVIFGAEDQLFDARQSISAYAAIPGVKTLLIPGVGHSPQIEAPEATATAVSEFADSLVPAPEPTPEPAKKPKRKQKSKPGGKQKKSGSKKTKSKAKQSKPGSGSQKQGAGAGKKANRSKQPANQSGPSVQDQVQAKIDANTEPPD